MKKLSITKSITNTNDNIKRFFSDIRDYKPLTKEEEHELFKRYYAGDSKAKDLLILCNCRFVVSIAKKYQNQGLDLEDLISYGLIGLTNAIDKFDLSKDLKFITYAVWQIRLEITQALYKTNNKIRVPINVKHLRNQIVKFTDNYFHLNGIYPSPEEICDEFDIDLDKYNLIDNSFKFYSSLDEPIGDDPGGNFCLVDVLENGWVDNPEQVMSEENLTAILNSVLKKLPPKHSDIIRMTFGIGMAPMFKEAIADRFGWSCERVRQILAEGIKMIQEEYKLKLSKFIT